ncbi:hypothetical protein DFH08DRAFT_927126 [Mycena albidolilacea]|uniref:Uncharacterized protein n=1 Tax=Mycena albidolilacea TaxID=1033008 RepID=A0AAD6Z934_9AGAR|nr:hypothetical protein DFH08DRAFT_927126 [Mycena albidolilacea]
MPSLPPSSYDPRRVCLNPFPDIHFGKHRRTVGVYLAGGLFALANWFFLDACILSAHAKAPWGQPDTPAPVHVTFVDWLPGLCSLLGFLVINLIDKDRVRGDADTFGDARAVWRARLFLFIGFALMAGGMAGSAAVLTIKYVLPAHADQFKYYGYASVAQNLALMLSVVVLWIAQNTSDDYEYNVTL